jgi:hypothetical protein
MASITFSASKIASQEFNSDVAKPGNYFISCSPQKLKDFICVDKIHWIGLSENPNAIHLLEKNPNKIKWGCLSSNPSIFELDYNAIKERCSVYKWELLDVAFHPSRIEKYIEMGIEMGELSNYI